MSEAAERIAAEIRKKGAIPFARFMELALYCPNCGYYEREEDRIGSQGDYYTSASATRLFGELLAFQFAEWLEQGRQTHTEPGRPKVDTEATCIVEAGAHDGALAGDILAWMLPHRPRLCEDLQYWIVEPSARRQARQRENLAKFGDRVRWAERLSELPHTSRSPGRSSSSAAVRGVVFSNELLDAMPVHRLGWDAKARKWFEWGVALQAERFVWTRMVGGEPGDGQPHSTALPATGACCVPVSDELLDVLPDGFTTELCLAAAQWWREAATVLEHGRLLTIDYGLTAPEFFLPERRQGTLRGYQRHRPSDDVLACPGEQDITAHVNFTAIREVGESAGLKTEAFLTQAQFLTRLAARAWQPEAAFGEWTPERTRQFNTLTHPEHLGQSFRVLVQSRT